ncbi:MAG: MFS transporter [Roseiflexaceae bacterium]|nr:MFS transporter [Roseiflexaceae bacterium]
MPHRRSPLMFLFVCVFVDMIGYGIVLPLLPLFVERQAAGGTVVGLLSALYAGVQTLGGPLLSGLSDRFGRRPVLLLSLLGTSAAYALLGLADTIWLLCAAIVLDGVTGGNLSIAQAFIADSTPPERRARGFGLLGAAFGLGLMVGPLIGGTLSQFSLSAPAFAAAAIALANVLLGLCILPESLPPERRVSAPLRSYNPFAQLASTLRAGPTRGLLLTVLLLNLAFSGLQSNFPIFSGARFGWDAQANGYFFAFVGVCAVLTQAALLGPAQARFGERQLVLAGIGLMAGNLLLVATLGQDWMLFPAVALLALGSNLAIPSLASLLSHTAAPEAQGRLMGVQQSVLNAALIGGPLLAGLSFDLIGPSAPYALGGLLAVCALAVAYRSTAGSRRVYA